MLFKMSQRLGCLFQTDETPGKSKVTIQNCQTILLKDCCRYLEAFLGLLTALLKKIQFSSNVSQLKEIDNVDMNDDVSKTNKVGTGCKEAGEKIMLVTFLVITTFIVGDVGASFFHEI
jgi:hypothetical protein